MEFSKFDLCLLLTLVEQKITELKINRLDLHLGRKYLSPDDFNIQDNNISLSIDSTENLKNKIKKIMEE